MNIPTYVRAASKSYCREFPIQTKGLLLVVMAVLWQGLGTAVVGVTVRPELSTFTTFAAFLTAAVLAGGIFFIHRRATPTSSSGLRFRDVAIINLVTAGAFSAFYVAATMIPPTAASVLETGLGPFLVVLAAGITVGNRTRQLLQPGLILLISVAIAYVAITSAPHPGSSGMTALGLILSVLAGCCAAGVLLTSHHLSTRGVTALQISAVRFHLAWLLSGIIALPAIAELAPHNTEDLWSSAVIGIVCIAAPILLLQWGITIAKPLHAALAISMLPAVVLFGDFLLTGAINLVLVVGMTALVSISLAAVLRRR